MKIVLGLLLSLLKLTVISVTAHDDGSADKPCRARAWVRAPDLNPGQVIQGDVKVKLDGACEEVLSYTLKLRFAERSWVKTRRQGVQLPERPAANSINAFHSNVTMFEPVRYGCLNNSGWDKYEDAVKDSSLWLVREEERIGFEAKYILCNGKHVSHDVVEPFAILIPSTTYPPAFDPLSGWRLIGHKPDRAGSEHIYAYVVDVAFLNGTILEVPAGYTSFNAPTKSNTPTGPETVNVTVSRTPPHINGNIHMSEVVERDVDMFMLEVTFPHGRHIEQGSVNNITVVSHQTGPGLEWPDRIGWLSLDVTQKHHWAASFAVDNETAEQILISNAGNHYHSQLRPSNPLAMKSPMSFLDPHYDDLISPRFPLDGAVPNGTMFSTNPITVQFRVSDCYPTFDMHYQTTVIELLISMRVHKAPLSNEEDTEEYDWVPTVNQQNNQPSPLLSAKIPLSIHSKEDDPTKPATTENIHYLSPEARAPVFVDPGSVKFLLQKSMDERDALSPKAQPQFITREGGDVVKDRYFQWNMRGQQLQGKYYVGDTWLRKVASPRKENEVENMTGWLRIQS